MATPEYKEWLRKRINDNILKPSLKGAWSLKECLQVIPSELEIIKQDFERQSLELGKKIEKLEEEKMYLKLDVDAQKSEAEKAKKEKRVIEEDRDSLKTE
ncbi:polyamine-modulated factor 1-binding protein 1-like [Gossypium australe]|uniref:Polyamine-modulated factor 1-binding protein 1-like n=1 Tax=Gossypium australe TaxID=47621 RepID=A0A5B6VXH6_9ROSI|nr:polyamine-modulated factor 1-binding protein 1-like [Gossypium australe]